MAKGKKANEESGTYLDYLGIGGDDVPVKGEGEKEGAGAEDQVAGLLKTIESLTSRVDAMQSRRAYGSMPAMAQTTAPTQPKLRDVTLEGLPSQADDPEGYASGLNARIGEAVNENMRALSVFNAETQALATQTAGRSDQLWSDFQDQYLTKLEKDLPDGVDALAYVEVAARGVAKKAARRGLNLDAYMYQTSEVFMEDVYAAAEKVLAPFREGTGKEGDGEGAGGDDDEVNRTGGIIGPGGTPGAKPKPDEDEDKGSLISDITEIQKKGGFY